MIIGVKVRVGYLVGVSRCTVTLSKNIHIDIHTQTPLFDHQVQLFTRCINIYMSIYIYLYIGLKSKINSELSLNASDMTLANMTCRNFCLLSNYFYRMGLLTQTHYKSCVCDINIHNYVNSLQNELYNMYNSQIQCMVRGQPYL